MNRTGAITILVLFMVVLLVGLYILQVRSTNEQETLSSSPAAQALSPDAKYTDFNGEPLTLNDYLGSVVIATSWASWCPNCVEQLNILSSVVNNNEQIAILAFNRAESLEIAKNFLQFYNLDTDVILVIDPTDNFFESINGYAMPETVVFNREGDIIHQERDVLEETDLLAILNRLE